MIKLPLEVLKEYQARLRALDVSSHESPHYVKWVRYFLDFEEKYGRNFEETKVVEGFIAKLASKGQSAGLRAQARRAVEIYQGLDRMVDEAPVAFKLDPDELARVKSKPQSVAAVEKKSNTVKRAPGKTGRGSPLKGKADAGSKDSRSFDNWAELQRAMTGEIKRRNYSPKTLSGYMKWVRQFGEFTDHMPVEEISDESARDFLTHLAVNGHVVASTQNQAFNALLFLFRHILKRDYELGDSVTRAKVSKYIPTVLTRSEVDAVLANLKFPHNLIVSMLYGCGLRLSECLELRMGDLDFDENLVIVHDGKGSKDRSLPMPKKLKSELKKQVKRVAKLLERDLATPDFGGAFMPENLSKRRAEREAKELRWQWLFPAKTLTLVPDEGLYRRYHSYTQQANQEIRRAVKKAGIVKRVTAHAFRHSFASHLLAANVDLRTIQELLGHSDIRTTMIYTHTVKSRSIKDMLSPLDLEDETEEEEEG